MPWVRGQSGNPGGRPKRKVLSTELVRALRARPPGEQATSARLVAEAIVALARGGDVPAARLCWEYTEGKPTQRIEFDLEAVAAELAQEHGVDKGRLLDLTRRLAARTG